MKAALKIPAAVLACTRCPKCRSILDLAPGSFDCTGETCKASYPVVDGVPILINEERSAFAISDFTSRESTTFHSLSGLERFFSRVIPGLTTNRKAEPNYRQLGGLLGAGGKKSRVLVVGCGDLGNGIDPLLGPAIELLNTDVCFGPYTQIICDSSDLPFEDGTFDGVVVQAVLEHVADPVRCVEEIHRVLRQGGLVYAETPFIQQVHGGPYDFTRFTHLGHRRLFRRFAEVASGAAVGPATALAWSYQYFLLSFVTGHKARLVVKAITRLTAFWLKYFDLFLIDKPAALDAASGYYFMGQKSGEPLSDRDLIGQYRGAGQTLPRKQFG